MDHVSFYSVCFWCFDIIGSNASRPQVNLVLIPTQEGHYERVIISHGRRGWRRKQSKFHCTPVRRDPENHISKMRGFCQLIMQVKNSSIRSGRDKVWTLDCLALHELCKKSNPWANPGANRGRRHTFHLCNCTSQDVLLGLLILQRGKDLLYDGFGEFCLLTLLQLLLVANPAVKLSRTALTSEAMAIFCCWTKFSASYAVRLKDEHLNIEHPISLAGEMVLTLSLSASTRALHSSHPYLGLRAQTLYRTVSGIMNYSKAIKLLYCVENLEVVQLFGGKEKGRSSVLDRPFSSWANGLIPLNMADSSARIMVSLTKFSHSIGWNYLSYSRSVMRVFWSSSRMISRSESRV